jgi:hypothetical protein
MNSRKANDLSQAATVMQLRGKCSNFCEGIIVILGMAITVMKFKWIKKERSEYLTANKRKDDTRH